MATGTLYRKCIWFYKGVTEYTRNGFVKASRSFTPTDLSEEDISDRAYMVTGANSGIGKSTAQSLASKGATVYLVCRNPERGEEAKREISENSKNEKIELLILDLSKPRDVVTFAEDFVASGKPLDVLVNNAGLMENVRTVDEDNLERNFCVNTLGTYILTSRLVPALEKSQHPRVVTVSSGGMLLMKLDSNDLQFENLTNFDGTFAYSQNKRQQVVMTRRWAEEHPKVYFASMHPGWADTPAVRTSMPDFHRRMVDRLRSPEQGADTIVWLCAAKAAATAFPSGTFFQDRQGVPEHLPLAQTRSSPEEEALLMSRLEDLARKFSSTGATNSRASGDEDCVGTLEP